MDSQLCSTKQVDYTRSKTKRTANTAGKTKLLREILFQNETRGKEAS